MAFDAQDATSEATDLMRDLLAQAGLPGRQDVAYIVNESGRSEQAAAGSTEPCTEGGQEPHLTDPRGNRKDTFGRGKARTKRTLGSVLRARRHDLQLTQRELAAKLGVNAPHIAYLESDHRRPSLSLLRRIAEVLDLDRERLILLSRSIQLLQHLPKSLNRLAVRTRRGRISNETRTC